MIEKEKNSIETVFPLVAFLSNLSQIPMFLSNSIVKIVIFFIWIFLASYIFLRYMKKLNLCILKFLWMVYIFDIFIMVLQVFTSKNYIHSNFIYPVNLSMFVLFVSYLIGQVSSSKIVCVFSKMFVYSSIIVSLIVYFTNFRGKDWMDSEGYLYKSKNSIALILVVALIFTIIYFKNRVMKLSIVIYISIMIIMLKSRTCLIGSIIAMLYWILFLNKTIKKKLLFILIVIMATVIIFSNSSLYDLFINKILLNNRENMNLNVITSGRISQYYTFFNEFKNVWLFGNGGLYIESFPLAALISYGLIGFILLFSMSMFPFFVALKYRHLKNYKDINITIVLINIIMIINSLFEELAPFGPGIKCYVLWCVTGLYLGLIYKDKIKN